MHQKTESFGDISFQLRLPVTLGRDFLIIELMLELSGLYCVVNTTGFTLSFVRFCQTAYLD